MPAQTAPAHTTNLFLVDDLEDVGRTSALAESDFSALRAVADRITTFVIQPHEDLGRVGPVCPFVPKALERKTLWLAPEQMADRSTDDVVAHIGGYQRLFLDAQPTGDKEAIYKSFVIVFTDLRADRARVLLTTSYGTLPFPPTRRMDS